MSQINSNFFDGIYSPQSATLYANSADDFLELASEQRLDLLQGLLVKKSKLCELVKERNSTKTEIHRNLNRLKESGMIIKGNDGKYQLTSYGNLLCSLIPSQIFVSQNKEYFSNHGFGNLPQKFIQRIGALESGKIINGFTRVVEKWLTIFQNSNEYIAGIIIEEPMSLIESIVKRAKKGVKVNSIFSDITIIPEGRKNIPYKQEIQELIENGIIERKMKKDVKVAVVLNEKEACVTFPTVSGEPDISKMFYGDDPIFHEWCLDYFRYCWENSQVFHETKLTSWIDNYKK